MDEVSQAQDRYSLLDTIPVGLCILRSDLVVLFWNSCLEAWTNISRQQILGSAINEHFPLFNQSKYAARLQEVFAGGPPVIFSAQLHQHIIPAPLPQGKQRIQHTTVMAVPAIAQDSQDGYDALFSIQDVTDLTFQVQEYRKMRDLALAEARDRTLAQQEAEAANRLKDEFLAVLSHELRSPLNPILGWTRLLKNHNFDTAATTKALDTIERNVRLQIQLIDDLLDVSRILRGKLSLEMVAVDLTAVIQAVCEGIRWSAEAKSIDLEMQLDADVGCVWGDVNRLQQVVNNLLSNAVKFTSPGGRITVKLSTVSSLEANQSTLEFAQIEIIDSGIGINPEFLPYVFERFRQADSSMTRKFGGLGLGLAIVRHLVELHGGIVTASSAGEGKGATFSVRLPLIPASAAVAVGDSPTNRASLDGLNILVVDDEVDTRELLGFFLSQSGANVNVAASTEEALAVLAQVKPDLLVSDIGMPEADGYSLIRTVRTMSAEEGGNIPAIALTAYATHTDVQRVLAAGFNRHIAKPVIPDDLIALIVELVISH